MQDDTIVVSGVSEQVSESQIPQFEYCEAETSISHLTNLCKSLPEGKMICFDYALCIAKVLSYICICIYIYIPMSMRSVFVSCMRYCEVLMFYAVYYLFNRHASTDYLLFINKC